MCSQSSLVTCRFEGMAATATAVKSRRAPLVARFEAAKEEVEDDLAEREEGDIAPDTLTDSLLPKAAGCASTLASTSRPKQPSASTVLPTGKTASKTASKPVSKNCSDASARIFLPRPGYIAEGTDVALAVFSHVYDIVPAYNSF